MASKQQESKIPEKKKIPNDLAPDLNPDFQNICTYWSQNPNYAQIRSKFWEDSLLHVGSSVLGGIGSKGFLLWVEVAVVSDERNEGGRERKKDG